MCIRDRLKRRGRAGREWAERERKATDGVKYRRRMVTVGKSITERHEGRDSLCRTNFESATRGIKNRGISQYQLMSPSTDGIRSSTHC